MSWFPGPNEKCTIGMKDTTENCKMNLQDLRKPFMNVAGKPTFSKQADLKQALKDYSADS